MRIAQVMKAAVLAATLAVGGAATAQASTLPALTVDLVIPAVPGEIISLAGQANVSANGISFSSLAPVPFLVNGTSFGTSDTLTVFQPPLPYLTGDLIDGVSRDGVVELLYALDFAEPSGNFRSLALVTLTETSGGGVFTEGTIAGIGTIPVGVSDDLRVGIRIEAVAPIPLPAGLALLLGGVGALVLARRRSTA